jgi:hypothetical protein
MGKVLMLLKKENYEVSYVSMGEYGECFVSSSIKTVSAEHLAYLMPKLLDTNLREMRGERTTMCLQSDVHRLTEVCKAKPNSHMFLQVVEADFFTLDLKVIAEYEYHVIQMEPTDFIQITKTV